MARSSGTSTRHSPLSVPERRLGAIETSTNLPGTRSRWSSSARFVSPSARLIDTSGARGLAEGVNRFLQRARGDTELATGHDRINWYTDRAQKTQNEGVAPGTRHPSPQNEGVAPNRGDKTKVWPRTARIGPPGAIDGMAAALRLTAPLP
jgi:hypothetical protein